MNEKMHYVERTNGWQSARQRGGVEIAVHWGGRGELESCSARDGGSSCQHIDF